MTLHEQELDETLEFAGVGKKRGASQGNKGRAVSIVRDDGDVAAQNRGVDFESSLPKRRRSAPAKRTKSAPGELNPLQQLQEQQNPSPASLHDSEHRKEDSQLTTPPDSGKQLPKKAAPKPRNPKFKPGPFCNPVITKSSVSRETNVDEDVTLPKPVTIHRGWTSTQEAVKHQFNGLSRTTLDKLAAFRYKSSGEAQADAPVITSGSPQVERERESVKEASGPPLSSDYGFLPSHDSVFFDGNRLIQGPFEPAPPAAYQIKQPQRAAWSPDHRKGADVFFSDAICNDNVGNTIENDVYSSQNPPLPPNAIVIPRAALYSNPNRPSIGREVPLLLASQSSHTVLSASQPASDYDEPSSSEMRALVGMVDGNPSAGYRDGICIPEDVQTDSFPLNKNQASVKHGLDRFHKTEDLQPAGLLASSHEIQEDDCYHLPQHGQTATENIPGGIPYPSHLVDIQVKRSRVDEPQTTHRSTSNNFTLDEFDDGVDDADFLAIRSDATMPETQALNCGTPKFHSGIDSSDTVPCARSAEQPSVNVAEAQLVREPRPASPEILSDDEFPLEDGLEEEDMASLPTHLQPVIETFEVPPSLEYSFGNGPMSGEVYDKSLQFSPPKSPSSVLQWKVADVTLTDGHSPSKTRIAEDLGSDSAEEEDWSFIRSDGTENRELPIMFDPNSDQENATPKIVKRIIPLGPRQQRKRSIYTNLPAATQSSTPQEIVLDDSHDYEPLQPFARPDFPSLVLDRSSLLGVSAQPFLRVCFRVGEMFKEGARCHALKQDAVIELFARVTFSSREPGSTLQHFQFADLWHDRPPFPNGILANCKTSGLAESESRAFIGAEEHMMARCIGRLRRDTKNSTGWLIDIINVRPTDWEEIKWTKRIVSAGLFKSEKGGI